MSNWREFRYTDNGFLILREIATYAPTMRGWQKKPYLVEREIVSPEYYENYITSIPFFNNWGDGASCRGYRNYTFAGYLPTRVVTTSPYRGKRIVATFQFVPMEQLTENAGWRENEIIANAKWYDIQYSGGRKMLILTTESDGVTAQGIYEIATHKWVN